VSITGFSSFFFLLHFRRRAGAAGAGLAAEVRHQRQPHRHRLILAIAAFQHQRLAAVGQLAADGALVLIGRLHREIKLLAARIDRHVAGHHRPAQAAGRVFVQHRVDFGKALQRDALAAEFAAVGMDAQIGKHQHAVARQRARLGRLFGAASTAQDASRMAPASKDVVSSST
jgi:hypothetical protein